MEDRIVGPVNSISSIDISTNGVSIASSFAEYVDLMSTGMGAQDGVSIQVVSI